MLYNYRCTKGCKLKDLLKSSIVTPEKDFMQVKSGDLVWEEKHGMTENPKIECPLCGERAERTMEGVKSPLFYIKGNCYLNRDDCRRQMDLHKLETGQDPYAGMRQPGEVDHLKKELKNSNKPKRKYLIT